MKWTYLQSILILFILLWFSEAKQRKKNLEKVLHEVIASLLLDENLDRHPRSNDTASPSSSTAAQRPDTTIYNYWLLPSNFLSISTTKATTTRKTTTDSNNYWLYRAPPRGSAASSTIEKLRDQIRYQALVKKTNLEFIAFLNKLIEDKKMELNEEDKEIKDEYAELNRTREALFRVYNKQIPDKKLEELRRKLAEKDMQYRELMSMHKLRRFTRDLHVDAPWININYPGGVIHETLRRKKSKNEFYESDIERAGEVSSVVNDEAHYRNGDVNRAHGIRHKGAIKHLKHSKVTTMSVGEILWKSLGKYLPFSGKNLANLAASIPLEVHYRLGKDVAHLTIRVCEAEEPTTKQFEGLRMNLS